MNENSPKDTSNDDMSDPFELIMLEEILRDVCNTYNRRVRIYEPIVNNVLEHISTQDLSDSAAYRLVPVKDSLQSFEMKVKSNLTCLTDFLDNDEDMVQILLTETIAAKKRGERLEIHQHESVELLVEDYVRQLQNTLLEVDFLLRRVQSKQVRIAKHCIIGLQSI